MAITGVSAISGEQIIAAGAVSARAAATASYTTGGNNLQGLYDTVSNNSGSWTGGPVYTGDAQGALDEVYTNSGTWNTVTDKLNTTAFSTVSGNFITAHQALPESANWNSTYDTVHDNSGSWTGGGTGGKTYTGVSPVIVDNAADTIAVSAKAIAVETPLTFTETNTAFVFGISGTDKWDSTYDTVHDNSASWTGGGGGAATLPVSGSAGNNSAVYGLHDMKIEYNLPSVGGGEPEHSYTLINNDSITVYGSYDEDQSYNHVYIYPEYIHLHNNSDEDGYIGAIDVLNWNSTYDTVHDNSASWTGGSTYTGDAQGALDEVYTNSGTWNTVTNKLDTTAFSTVSGNFLTAHQALPDSANWNSTYNTVSVNSGSWSSRPQEPVSGINIDIFESDGKVVFSGMSGGSDFTGLFQAQYGTTTYSDIKNAVDNHKIVYCQSGGRMAFLAYSGSNNYEFQYYRSLTGHTTASQGDQVFVYTISNNNTWGVTTRNTYTEIKPSAGLTSAFTNGAAAKLTFSVSNDILNATASVAANSANWQSAYDQLGNVTALLNSL